MPGQAVPIGAAALVEDGDGGRVYLHGNLWLAWEAGDGVIRRLAATQLVATRAGSAVAVAASFGVNRETLRRWAGVLAGAGAVGLAPRRRGAKGPRR